MPGGERLLRALNRRAARLRDAARSCDAGTSMATDDSDDDRSEPALDTPYALLGGEARVVVIAEAFYDAMEAHEPALTGVHRSPEPGRVHPEVRANFALFLVGWFGGPQTYTATHGHPRLRVRHAHVRVDVAMRDAWLRSMTRALDACDVHGDIRAFLDSRFAEVANFLRNTPE